MLLSVAQVITGMAIVLLVIYAADVAVTQASEDDTGFIPFDHRTRGIVLGLPALILPIVGYAISRKESSKGLGVMIIVVGILIVAGGAFMIANADPAKTAESGRNVVFEAVPLLVAGGVQIALGILKIKKA